MVGESLCIFSSLAKEKELVYLPYFCPSLMYKISKYD